MKTKLYTLIFSISFAVSGFAQSSKVYATSGLEFIFSGAQVTQNGKDIGSSLRFAPVVNIQSMLNQDITKSFGLFTGLAVRNVGYITKGYVNPTDTLTYEKRFRSYNLGVPVGIKFGNLKKLFFYAGYEFELGVLYKEKKYEGGDKTEKITGWFSDRQNLFQHGFLVGIQLPYGSNIKFKYYLSEFHNTNYVGSNGIKPYAGLKSNIFYVSLNYCLFKDTKVYIYDPNYGD